MWCKYWESNTIYWTKMRIKLDEYWKSNVLYNVSKNDLQYYNEAKADNEKCT